MGTHTVDLLGARSEDQLHSTPWLSRRLYLVPVLMLASLLRFAVAYGMAAHGSLAWFYLQATELFTLAESILSHHGLASPFGGSTGPSAFLAPGYPAIVALAFRLFGIESDAAAVALISLQTLFNVAAIGALMLIAKRIFGYRVANIAGILWATSPPLLWIPLIFWETSFSLCAMTMMFFLLLRCADKPDLARWLTIGACCGVSMLVNPSLVFVFTAGVVWAAWQKAAQKITGPLLAGMICFLIFVPWPIRNLNVLHAFVPFRTNLGYELWQGNRSGSNGSFSVDLHPNINRIEFQHYASRGELDFMHDKSVSAMTTIEGHPVHFIERTFWRMIWFWTGLGNSGARSTILTIHIMLTTLLGFAGLVMMLRQRQAAALLFTVAILLFPLPYYLTHSDPRFRLVLDPLMTILASHAMVVMAHTKRHKQRESTSVQNL